MGEVSYTVPAEHVEAFRIAVRREIKSDARGVEPEEASDVDLKNQVRRVSDALALLEQLDGDGPIEVNGDSDQMFHAAEEMARLLIERLQKDVLPYGPLPTPEARELIAGMTWALDRVEECDKVLAAEFVARDARKAEHAVSV